MGVGPCCTTLSDAERSANVQSHRITQALRQDFVKQAPIIKLLLLGAGESGKSTIVKQMKIIHTSGFSSDDCIGFRHVLHTNLLESVRAIVEAMDILGLEFSDLENEALSAGLAKIAPGSDGLLSLQDLELLERLWHDGGMQACFGRSCEFHLSDGASYLLDNINRYKSKDFVPREQDILHIRVETKGIIEVDFTYKETKFTLYDVGGQRNQRRKWIHCFDNVMAIIFCAALSGYDMMLAEDGTTNRMLESLDLFKGICNSEVFTNTSMLLFLNKTDLLRRKVAMSPLTACFPEYRGPQDYDSVAGYIEMKFMAMNTTRDEDKIYVHRTCATDTYAVKSVFKVAAQAIMRENLERCGLM